MCLGMEQLFMYIIEPRLVSSHMECVRVSFKQGLRCLASFKQGLRCLALAKTWLAH